MDSLVLQLQKEALNSNHKVVDLLRKATVLAVKLRLSDLKAWIDLEVNGYENSDVPDYRVLTGKPSFWNPHFGWCPISFRDPEMLEALSTCKNKQPIESLEAIALSDGNGSLESYYSPSIEVKLAQNNRGVLRPVLLIDKPSVAQLVGAVRDRILSWALQLEVDGILGEGLTFSQEEKKMAAEKYQNVTYNIGSMTNSQLQHSPQDSPQSMTLNPSPEKIADMVALLKTHKDDLELSAESTTELNEKISELETAIENPDENSSIVGECLGGIRRVLEGVSSNIIASGLLHHLETLMI